MTDTILLIMEGVIFFLVLYLVYWRHSKTVSLEDVTKIAGNVQEIKQIMIDAHNLYPNDATARMAFIIKILYDKYPEITLEEIKRMVNLHA